MQVFNLESCPWPVSTSVRQSGVEGWQKTFVCSHYYHQRLNLQVWVGTEQQSFLTMDERYRIPYYVGHRGWIDLDVTGEVNWQEIENLVLTSYRHFALQRMLKLLA
ncbi:MAG: MmcQ/YjbR family DNA-binding protein [Proteobacteria bacterium]|nr:MmcQ/YjbR family DNA-binding protein [Pseudomonadota bacterium]